MTFLIIGGIGLAIGLAFGIGGTMIVLNQRKVNLDPWTDRYGIDDQDVVAGEEYPIGIIDLEYDPPNRIGEIGMLNHEQHERVCTAQFFANALNCYRGD